MNCDDSFRQRRLCICQVTSFMIYSCNQYLCKDKHLSKIKSFPEHLFNKLSFIERKRKAGLSLPASIFDCGCPHTPNGTISKKDEL